MLVQAQVGEHVDAEAGAVGGHLAVPVLAVVAGQAVVGELEVLEVHSDGEAEVDALLVGVRAVEQLVVALLRGGGEHCQQQCHHEQQAHRPHGISVYGVHCSKCAFKQTDDRGVLLLFSRELSVLAVGTRGSCVRSTGREASR